MSMEKLLEASKTQLLRETGVISQTEIVKIIGDICVAEDVVSGARRHLVGVNERTIATKRQLLKD